MTEPTCPFCQPSIDRIAFVDELVFALWDGFPVSPGHLLIIPKRHFSSWFEATVDEHAALLEAIRRARGTILSRHRPDAFNIGVNVGSAAGQTVPHLHVHLIPRYAGDVPNPRGGVRNVIPGKGDYLAPSLRSSPLPPPRLVTGGEGDPLLPYLAEQFAVARHADIAVGFVQPSGLTRIEAHLHDFLSRGGRLRLLTGDYLGITHPDALVRLLDLQGEREIRVFETQRPPQPEWPGPSAVISFHPKSYIFRSPEAPGVAFVGSSNLTESALTAGLEWNYRVVSSQEGTPFSDIVAAFESLFQHPATVALDLAWIDQYRRRRPSQALSTAPAEVPPEVEAPPKPHPVQVEALAALAATRACGNTAGLVVLATGLGKTWLAAFDSSGPSFRRILFVAHREEILGQALRTFRRVRPAAQLGLYTGAAKEAGAEILFASIQTLGRNHHLERFSRGQFDYVIVDEFHHASAATYRRLIDYFTPKFLLGLTATPDRTDGGDLLALCQENLVYECGLAAGLKRDLLCKFRYFGVPDDLDYSNIPWRSTGFDEEVLTARLAVDARAANALEQLQRHAGSRTIAFCVSQRHADFMAGYLSQRGHRAVAVHSGPTSAPRAESLEKLAGGHLDAICAVDVFNEGLDLPELDTVLMLRPTESRILFLQQLGRGLRKTASSKTLNVIDYIGNHRAFLLKPRALFDLGTTDGEVADLLERAKRGPIEIAPGCFVTYDLVAIDLLARLLRVTPDRSEALRRYYEDFRDLHGQRPTATEAFHDDYDPAFPGRKGSHWFGLVGEMGDLSPGQARAAARHRAWLQALETTDMTRSYKILVLLAMLNRDAFPGEISIGDLADGVDRLASRNPRLRSEIGLRDELADLLVQHPLAAWTAGRGTKGVSYFAFDEQRFRTTFPVEQEDRAPLQELTREIAEWRLARHLRRRESPAEGMACSVKHSGGRPIVFLPDRAKHPGLPDGPTSLAFDGESYEGVFTKIAINVVRRAGATTNELPGLLRGWFGPDAGMPGTNHQVALAQDNSGAWSLKPLGRREGAIELWRPYSREQIPPLFGLDFSVARWNKGFVAMAGRLFLLVTLAERDRPQQFAYKNRFLSPRSLEWQSQNQTAKASKHGLLIQGHEAKAVAVHLFVRHRARGPFRYCGDVRFVGWGEGEKPITVRWELPEPVPDRLWQELQVPPGVGPGGIRE